MSVKRVASTATAMAKISISLLRAIASAATRAAAWTRAAILSTTMTIRTAAITAWVSTKSVKTVFSKRRKKMPSEPLPVGDILIIRDGLQNIANDAESASAKRKQARMLVRCLDELLARREKEASDVAKA